VGNTGEVTVTFSGDLPRGECTKRLGRLGNAIARAAGHDFTVLVPDGTQFEWASRYGRVPGVMRVHYARPASVGAPN